MVQTVKNLPAMGKTQVWSLGWEDPWRRTWQLTPVFLPGESHGQRSLWGYSPWGHKESDTPECVSLNHFMPRVAHCQAPCFSSWSVFLAMGSTGTKYRIARGSRKTLALSASLRPWHMRWIHTLPPSPPIRWDESGVCLSDSLLGFCYLQGWLPWEAMPVFVFFLQQVIHPTAQFTVVFGQRAWNSKRKSRFGVRRWLVGGSDSKESTCNARDPDSIPGSGRFPWRRKWPLTPVFLPGESRGQRSLAVYSPWGHRVRHDWATNTFTLRFTHNTVHLDQENIAHTCRMSAGMHAYVASKGITRLNASEVPIPKSLSPSHPLLGKLKGLASLTLNDILSSKISASLRSKKWKQ